MQNIPLRLHRQGYAEQAYSSFFYSPLRDDAVRGLFGACTEITAQVLAWAATVPA